MNVNNLPKFVGILVAMVLLTVVFSIGNLTESGYIGLMGLIVGYLVGNGTAARNGDPVVPVFGETDTHRENRQ